MTDVLPTGLVVYADGSARPNPGFHGSGIHGYSYIYPEDKKFTKINSWVATDKGYVLEKDLETSKAIPVLILSYFDGLQSYSEAGTNNIAEILAVKFFFDSCKDLINMVEKIQVLTDSQYVVNGLSSWVYGWIKSGWITGVGLPVKNADLWKMTHEEVVSFQEHGKFSISWVRGHNDNFGNVKADYLAGIATILSSKNEVSSSCWISDPKAYHKVNIEINDLLSLKRLYFNTDKEFNIPGTYYMSGADDKAFDGKRTPDSVFAVIKLKQPDPVIENIITAQEQHSVEENLVMYIKLSRIASADLYPYLERFGSNCLYKDTRNQSLNFVDFKAVTFEPRAIELPLRAIDTIGILNEALEWFEQKYIAGNVPTGRYNAHEITDHFYAKVEKKRGKEIFLYPELKKEYKVGVKKTKVKITEEYQGKDKELTLPLVFQDDLPNRNILKRLENSSPRIFLITWMESERLLRYGTVLQTDEAIGIWSNYFANQHLFV